MNLQKVEVGSPFYPKGSPHSPHFGAHQLDGESGDVVMERDGTMEGVVEGGKHLNDRQHQAILQISKFIADTNIELGDFGDGEGHARGRVVGRERNDSIMITMEEGVQGGGGGGGAGGNEEGGQGAGGERLGHGLERQEDLVERSGVEVFFSHRSGSLRLNRPQS